MKKGTKTKKKAGATKSSRGKEKLSFAIDQPKDCTQVQQNGNLYLLHCSGSGPADAGGTLPRKVFVKWYRGNGAHPSLPPGDATSVNIPGSNAWSVDLNMNINASELGSDFTFVAWYGYGMFSQIRMIEDSLFQPQTEPCADKKPVAKKKK